MSDRWDRDNSEIGLLQHGGCYNTAAQLAISSYIDGEADPDERALAESHLIICRACQNRMVRWRQEARLISNPLFSSGPAYQIQADVRTFLQPILTQKITRTRPDGFPVTAFLATTLLLTCTVLLTLIALNNPTIIEMQTAVALTITASTTTTAHAEGTVMYNTLRVLPPTKDLSEILKSTKATRVRSYPAPEGRFSGLTGVIAWYENTSSRLWIVDAMGEANEVSLADLSESNEAVYFCDDTQALIWSERGAIVAFHLSNSKSDDWGLVIPEIGQIRATRLVQSPTATALAMSRPVISPLPRQ